MAKGDHGDDDATATGRDLDRPDPADQRDDRAASSSQRVDKWLWHARAIKTRTLAAKFVEAGRVRRNRERLTKPSDVVRPGDVLTLALPSRVVVWRIIGFSDHRGPAPEAAKL
ncbi:MAG: RNA-binding S4 domain-containing protein, partial [Ancalomicrobiaceae bacterium]|nr:RNA-binding S4 domain-containing protein [Ancalomicrobiaceae bacterium]